MGLKKKPTTTKNECLYLDLHEYFYLLRYPATPQALDVDLDMCFRSDLLAWSQAIHTQRKQKDKHTPKRREHVAMTTGHHNSARAHLGITSVQASPNVLRCSHHKQLSMTCCPLEFLGLEEKIQTAIPMSLQQPTDPKPPPPLNRPQPPPPSSPQVTSPEAVCGPQKSLTPLF